MEKTTYGLLLATVNQYGTDYIKCRVVKREGNHHAPRNCSRWSSYDDAPYYDGLTISGFVSDNHSTYLDHGPRYENVYSVEERDAAEMLKVLRKINKRIQADQSFHPVYVFASLCNALKLSFCVEQVGVSNSSTYDECQWKWMSCFAGGLRYQQMIEELRAKKAA